MKKFNRFLICKAVPDSSDDYEWLVETCGNPNIGGRWWYDHGSAQFFFSSEKDAMWYELRWLNEIAN